MFAFQNSSKPTTIDEYYQSSEEEKELLNAPKQKIQDKTCQDFKYFSTNLLFKKNLNISNIKFKEISLDFILKKSQEYLEKFNACQYPIMISDPKCEYNQIKKHGFVSTLIPYDEVLDLCQKSLQLYSSKSLDTQVDCKQTQNNSFVQIEQLQKQVVQMHKAKYFQRVSGRKFLRIDSVIKENGKRVLSKKG